LLLPQGMASFAFLAALSPFSTAFSVSLIPFSAF
jgi:hypothetical protein